MRAYSEGSSVRKSEKDVGRVQKRFENQGYLNGVEKQKPSLFGDKMMETKIKRK